MCLEGLKYMRGYSKLLCHTRVPAAQTVSFHVKLNRVNIRRLGELAEKIGNCPCKGNVTVFVSVIIHSNRF